ncbi:MAG: helix-turn-helix domain-containing protein [Candidatus Omnitrophica bacterium]|nr:helix-turn-helix domain-containing protein [Candidatus Omnitrophota bacterium]
MPPVCETQDDAWLIFWYKEYFRVSTREITKQIGVTRSTIYRWMRKMEDTSSKKTEPANKTPIELVRLVWEIAKTNPLFIGWRSAEVHTEPKILRKKESLQEIDIPVIDCVESAGAYG